MKIIFFGIGVFLGSLLMPLLLQWLILITREPIVMRSADGWHPATDCNPVDIAPVVE